METAEYHPYANFYPLMDAEELAELAHSIRSHGQREPILLHQDGSILDGRNRYRACVLAGVAPVMERFAGTDAEALRLVFDLNSVRRHLSASQKAIVAARLATYSHGGTRTQGGDSTKTTQREAAAVVHVSERLVRDAKVVLDAGSDDLLNAVERGILAVRTAAEVVRAGGHERALVAELHRLRRVSRSDEWRTPRHIVDLAVDVLGRIDLDPASNEGAPWVPAAEHFTKAQNGLAREWRGKVFLNPPWNAQASPARWVRKLLEEFDAGRVDEAILLVPSRTNTAWTALLAKHPRCHVRGRLKFNDGVGASAFATAIFYLGPNHDTFARTFSRVGDIFVPLSLMKGSE